MLPLLRLFSEPFTVLHLLGGLALLRLGLHAPRPRRWRLWLFAPYLLLTLCSLPAVGLLALGSLEWQTPPTLQRPGHTQAIVVLGSAVLSHDPVLSRAELDGPALDRTWHAYRVYRHGPPCLIVVSGGKPEAEEAGPAVADLMGRELQRLGVPDEDLLIENLSQNTYENAVESCRLLHERGLTHIVLVTDAEHLPRALACFHKQGVNPTPSAGRRRSGAWEPAIHHFIPSFNGLSACQDAAHEWVVLALYRLRGRA